MPFLRKKFRWFSKKKKIKNSFINCDDNAVSKNESFDSAEILSEVAEETCTVSDSGIQNGCNEDTGCDDDCLDCLQAENEYLRHKCESLLTLLSQYSYNINNQEKEINRLRLTVMTLKGEKSSINS